MYITVAHDSIHWFMNDLTSKIVAETQKPDDRFHLGKILYWSLKDDPDFIMQIDGATDESETNGSVLKRSTKCAVSLTKFGLRQGDCIILMGPNSIDLAIPLYAALFIGVKVAPLDATLGVNELKNLFLVNEPSIVFCENEKAMVVHKALQNAGLEAEIIIFGETKDFISMTEFTYKYSDEPSVKNFRPADLDPENTVAILGSTSGTTGLPKSAVLTHKNFAISLPYIWENFSKFPNPTKMVMVVSQIQWMSAVFYYIFTPIIKCHRLQSSKPITQEVFCTIINKYKPTYMATSPTLMTSILKPNEGVKCDITSFEMILITGSAVPPDLIKKIKEITPRTIVASAYGLTEVAGIAFQFNITYNGSLGKRLGHLDYRLVNIETMQDVLEPNVQGELWLRGPGICKGYYKNPESTAEAFQADGWFKTGDIFYRDDDWNFYFVERLKLLLKYQNYQISPGEVEAVIRQHPGVLDVALTGIPDPDCGDLIVACVVTKFGVTVKAQEIKDLVKESLSDSKQLRGGVIFMRELPVTSTTKVDRRKLKTMVLNMERE